MRPLLKRRTITMLKGMGAIVCLNPTFREGSRLNDSISMTLVFLGLLHFEWVKNPAAARERGTGQGFAEFFVRRKRGMISPCTHHDGWLTHTAFPAFAHGLLSTASSVTPRPVSFASCGRGKNTLWC